MCARIPSRDLGSFQIQRSQFTRSGQRLSICHHLGNHSPLCRYVAALRYTIAREERLASHRHIDTFRRRRVIRDTDTHSKLKENTRLALEFEHRRCGILGTSRAHVYEPLQGAETHQRTER